MKKEEPKQFCKNCKIEISKYGCGCGKQKEEPKQETLEEAIERLYYTKGLESLAFEEGAKWKQQQNKNLYSDEEVLEHLNHLIMMPSSKLDEFTDDEEKITLKWFEQFKKK